MPILRFSKLKENGSKFFDYILLLNSAKNFEGNDVGIIFVDRPNFSKIAKNFKNCKIEDGDFRLRQSRLYRISTSNKVMYHFLEKRVVFA